MLIKTPGIVLRQIKYGESSLIVDIYSRELGLQSYLVQGARKPRSRLPASRFQVMTLLDAVVYHHDKPTLKRIKEAAVSVPYQSMPGHMPRNAVGIYLVEFFRNALPQVEPHPDLFAFVWNAFARLDSLTTGLAVYPHRIMLGLSQFLGFQPEVPETWTPGASFDLREGRMSNLPPRHLEVLRPELSRFLAPLVFQDHEAGVPEGLTGSLRAELLRGLVDYYRLHLEDFRVPRSVTILHQVLGG